MASRLNRREFLRQAAMAGAAGSLGLTGCSTLPSRRISPNEKLNIGCIGVAGRGGEDIKGVMHESIVALCDIDDNNLAAAKKKFPWAKTYNDFRRMIENKELDAVVIGTPDHIHAPASMMAMQCGLHVYCEKPLTHSVYEARRVARLAADSGKATQMGTQIHAGENYRRVVEMIQSGAIGPVREAHVWVGKAWSGGDRPKDRPPVPPNIHWDLWLGPAPERPYNPTYLPQNWRRWWDFGGGTLGDMGCHYMDLVFWSLGIQHPTSIEAQGPPPHLESAPEGLVVNYEFPAAGSQPAMRLTWYDGGKRPPHLKENNMLPWESGVLFVGDKGMMLAGYDAYHLYPEHDFKDYTPPPPSIEKSVGHHQEWINACKTGSPTTCHFGYGGMITETVLLGNVAFRLGQKLDWDARNLKVTNVPEAEHLIRRAYRKGWSL